MSASPLESGLAFPPPDLVGRRVELTHEWTERDVLLYALGVGAGQADALRELELTTENSRSETLHVIPTFGVLLTQDTIGIGAAGADPAMVVHAMQSLRLHRPLPVHGRVRTEAEVVEILDKGSGALVTTQAHAIDLATDTPLITTRSAVFVRGAGGFGGMRTGRGVTPDRPSTLPDRTYVVATRPDQALLYRLSGDRNPLHSDPEFAARAGFERPILHGLATFGITGRVLFTEFCRSEPERFLAIEGRFTAPVLPGQRLVISVWDDGGTAIRFRTETEEGVAVLDFGHLELVR